MDVLIGDVWHTYLVDAGDGVLTSGGDKVGSLVGAEEAINLVEEEDAVDVDIEDKIDAADDETYVAAWSIEEIIGPKFIVRSSENISSKI